MKSYSFINNIVGWTVFIVATLVYLFTMEPTVSFWDCGEFISGAYKLQVVHPPGAPMFLLIARMFTLFASGPETVALMVNTLSALASSFSVLFLFWTITAIAKKIMIVKSEKPEPGNLVAVMGAGVVGAMACCFADSFWFSAVEGEVYALSSFFTALVVWAIFKWDNISDKKGANRWLVFIAFMMGISIGVHLLNLLTIPAIAYVYYYKKFKPSMLGFLVTGVTSVVILGFIQVGIIQKIPEMLTSFELFFTNSIGMGFNSGSWVLIILLFSIIIAGVILTHLFHDKLDQALREFPISAHNINTAIMCLGMIMIGYSSYFMVVIRSTANPAIDMNNPEDPFNLLSYLQREQYGSAPILYGQYYTAQQVDKEAVGEKYYQGVNEEGDDEYIYKSTKYEMLYEEGEGKQGFFPRMWSPQDKHKRTYRNIIEPTYEVQDYSGNTLKHFKKLKAAKSFVQKSGNPRLRIVDQFNFFDNLKFFFSYQIGHMYARYFLWNFGGRQNDIQGHMNLTDGNWVSGIDFIDEMRDIIPNSELPTEARNNKGYNPFYLLPFLLGLIGVFYHFNTRRDDAFIVFLLWFMTGIAVVIFLNQYPYQPRERDYAFAGSVYAFCIWIGIGVLGVSEFIKLFVKNNLSSATIASTVCLISVPFLMGFHGWDDHDRSNRYMARDFAINYLESCEPNAILFTQGDNDTYPLWYAQEVEGIRQDIRIVNLSLLAVDWYIDYLKRAINETGPVPFTLKPDQYRGNNRDVVIHKGKNLKDKELLADIKKNGYSAEKTIKYILSEDDRKKLQTSGDEKYSTFPFKKLRIDVDRSQIEANEVLNGSEWNKFDSVLTWKVGKRMLYKNDLMVLDLVAHNNWERPIYFAVSVSPDAYVGLEKFFRLEGLAYRLVPVTSKNESGYYGYVDTDKMYDNLINKFKFGGIEKEPMYMDEGVLRMAMNLRIQYARLAQALIDNGELDKAKNAIDKCMVSLPESNVPYGLVMMQYVDLYYQVGEKEKARELVESMVGSFEEKVDFYELVQKEYPNNLLAYKTDFRQTFTVAQNIMRYVEVNEDKQYADDMKTRLQNEFAKAQTIGQQMFSR